MDADSQLKPERMLDRTRAEPDTRVLEPASCCGNADNSEATDILLTLHNLPKSGEPNMPNDRFADFTKVRFMDQRVNSYLGPRLGTQVPSRMPRPCRYVYSIVVALCCANAAVQHGPYCFAFAFTLVIMYVHQNCNAEAIAAPSPARHRHSLTSTRANAGAKLFTHDCPPARLVRPTAFSLRRNESSGLRKRGTLPDSRERQKATARSFCAPALPAERIWDSLSATDRAPGSLLSFGGLPPLLDSFEHTHFQGLKL